MKHTVKSILCLILILGMMCSLVACGEDITGHYELVSATMNGQTYTDQEMREFLGNETELFIELNADGTGTMAFLGITAEMQWEGDQIWSTTNGTKATFTVEDGTLTLDLFNTVLVFQK